VLAQLIAQTTELPLSSADVGLPKCLAVLSALLLRFLHRYSLKSPLFTGWRIDLNGYYSSLSVRIFPVERRDDLTISYISTQGGKIMWSVKIFTFDIFKIFIVNTFKIFHYKHHSFLFYISPFWKWTLN